jgi:hypothetical protein
VYRIRTLAVVLLLLLYGAVGARQPAVRTSVPLGFPADRFANALQLTSADRGRLLVDTVRLVFDAPDGQDTEDMPRRVLLQRLLAARTPQSDTVPLALDPSVWRESILRRQVPDDRLVAAIFSERRTALLYHGLAALDDETLGALGPDRDTLRVLLQHAGTFSTFGRSLVIHAGRVVVPGGMPAGPLWRQLAGADPEKPGAFARRLMTASEGRLAYFFDTIAHLPPTTQQFAMGSALPASERLERLRALYAIFQSGSASWQPDARPFQRPIFDPALTLSLLRTTDGGQLAPPASRRVWERVFESEEGAPDGFVQLTSSDLDRDDTPVDAAWLMARIHRVDPKVGRRRLETLLFAQRMLGASRAPDETIASLALGYAAYPALFQTLEAMHAGEETMTRAAARARSLDALKDRETRVQATELFQASLGLLARVQARNSLVPAADDRAALALIGLDPAEPAYAARVAKWARRELLPARHVLDETSEAGLVSALSGVRAGDDAAPAVRWEGRRYRVDAAHAEQRRIERIRRLQGGQTLDEALTAIDAANAGHAADKAFTRVLVSFLYAVHLGEPEDRALAGGNPALRHDLTPSGQPARAWEAPSEEILPGRGWRLQGSLLGMADALARHALRRLDASVMPPEPRLSLNERRTAAMAVALLNPERLTDAARDEIAAAVARGRARLATLTADQDDIARAARDAGLSEWRREALAWSIVHEPSAVPSQLSLLEIMWLGSPRQLAGGALDAWGASPIRLTGCACLEMPRPRPWEDLAGRPAQGVLATRAADVSIAVADMLASRRLPAALAPAVLSFAMEDVLDDTQPAYYGDWSGFTTAASRLSAEQLEDYVSALAAGGPLVPLPEPASTGTSDGR